MSSTVVKMCRCCAITLENLTTNVSDEIIEAKAKIHLKQLHYIFDDVKVNTQGAFLLCDKCSNVLHIIYKFAKGIWKRIYKVQENSGTGIVFEKQCAYCLKHCKSVADKTQEIASLTKVLDRENVEQQIRLCKICTSLLKHLSNFKTETNATSSLIKGLLRKREDDFLQECDFFLLHSNDTESVSPVECEDVKPSVEDIPINVQSEPAAVTEPNSVSNLTEPNLISNLTEPNLISNATERNLISNSTERNLVSNTTERNFISNSTERNLISNSTEPQAPIVQKPSKVMKVLQPIVPPTASQIHSMFYNNLPRKSLIEGRLYICKLCNNSFSNQSILQLHEISHFDGGSNVKTEKPDYYELECFEVMNKRNVAKKLECQHCSKIFKDEQELSFHMETNEGSCNCDECNEHFRAKCALIAHDTLIHPQSSNLIEFKQTNPILSETTFFEKLCKCPKCNSLHYTKDCCAGSNDDSLADARYNLEAVVKEEVSKQAPENNTSDAIVPIKLPPPEPNKYTCLDCGKIYYRKVCFLKHKQLHSQAQQSRSSGAVNNNLQCSFCKESFKRMHLLLRHERQYSVHLKQMHACDECERTFPTMCCLLVHYRTHNKCVYCRSVFTKRDFLTHTRFQNNCTKCSTKFSPECVYLQHMESHRYVKARKRASDKGTGNASTVSSSSTGGAKHVCKFCGKVLLYKVSLENHERLHTSQTPFLCNICRQSFPNRSDCAKHKLEAHVMSSKYNFRNCDSASKRRNYGGARYRCKSCNISLETYMSWRLHFKEHKRKEAVRKEVRRKEAQQKKSQRKQALLRQYQHAEALQKDEALRRKTLQKDEELEIDALQREALRSEALLRKETAQREVLRKEALQREALLRKDAQVAEATARYVAEHDAVIEQYEGGLQRAKDAQAIVQEANQQTANFTCQHCGREFGHLSYCRIHERHSTEQGLFFFCIQCNEHFNAKCAWLSHNMQNHQHCQFCKRTFGTQGQYYGHIALQTTNPPYVCVVCNLSFPARCLLMKHEKVHSIVAFRPKVARPKRYHPAYNKYKHPKKIRTNFSDEVANLDAVISSNVADKAVTNRDPIISNAAPDVIDAEKITANADDDAYKCTNCYTQFGDESQYLWHKVKYPNKNSLGCQICNISFGAECALIEHNLTHGVNYNNCYETYVRHAYRKKKDDHEVCDIPPAVEFIKEENVEDSNAVESFERLFSKDNQIVPVAQDVRGSYEKDGGAEDTNKLFLGYAKHDHDYVRKRHDTLSVGNSAMAIGCDFEESSEEEEEAFTNCGENENRDVKPALNVPELIFFPWAKEACKERVEASERCGENGNRDVVFIHKVKNTIPSAGDQQILPAACTNNETSGQIFGPGTIKTCEATKEVARTCTENEKLEIKPAKNDKVISSDVYLALQMARASAEKRGQNFDILQRIREEREAASKKCSQHGYRTIMPKIPVQNAESISSAGIIFNPWAKSACRQKEEPPRNYGGIGTREGTSIQKADEAIPSAANQFLQMALSCSEKREQNLDVSMKPIRDDNVETKTFGEMANRSVHKLDDVSQRARSQIMHLTHNWKEKPGQNFDEIGNRQGVSVLKVNQLIPSGGSQTLAMACSGNEGVEQNFDVTTKQIGNEKEAATRNCAENVNRDSTPVPKVDKTVSSTEEQMLQFVQSKEIRGQLFDLWAKEILPQKIRENYHLFQKHKEKVRLKDNHVTETVQSSQTKENCETVKEISTESHECDSVILQPDQDNEEKEKAKRKRLLEIAQSIIRNYEAEEEVSKKIREKENCHYLTAWEYFENNINKELRSIQARENLAMGKESAKDICDNLNREIQIFEAAQGSKTIFPVAKMIVERKHPNICNEKKLEKEYLENNFPLAKKSYNQIHENVTPEKIPKLAYFEHNKSNEIRSLKSFLMKNSFGPIQENPTSQENPAELQLNNQVRKRSANSEFAAVKKKPYILLPGNVAPQVDLKELYREKSLTEKWAGEYEVVQVKKDTPVTTKPLVQVKMDTPDTTKSVVQVEKDTPVTTKPLVQVKKDTPVTTKPVVQVKQDTPVTTKPLTIIPGNFSRPENSEDVYFANNLGRKISLLEAMRRSKAELLGDKNLLKALNENLNRKESPKPAHLENDPSKELSKPQIAHNSKSDLPNRQDIPLKTNIADKPCKEIGNSEEEQGSKLNFATIKMDLKTILEQVISKEVNKKQVVHSSKSHLSNRPDLPTQPYIAHKPCQENTNSETAQGFKESFTKIKTDLKTKLQQVTSKEVSKEQVAHSSKSDLPNRPDLPTQCYIAPKPRKEIVNAETARGSKESFTKNKTDLKTKSQQVSSKEVNLEQVAHSSTSDLPNQQNLPVKTFIAHKSSKEVGKSEAAQGSKENFATTKMNLKTKPQLVSSKEENVEELEEVSLSSRSILSNRPIDIPIKTYSANKPRKEIDNQEAENGCKENFATIKTDFRTKSQPVGFKEMNTDNNASKGTNSSELDKTPCRIINKEAYLANNPSKKPIGFAIPAVKNDLKTVHPGSNSSKGISKSEVARGSKDYFPAKNHGNQNANRQESPKVLGNYNAPSKESTHGNVENVGNRKLPVDKGCLWGKYDIQNRANTSKDKSAGLEAMDVDREVEETVIEEEVDDDDDSFFLEICEDDDVEHGEGTLFEISHTPNRAEKVDPSNTHSFCLNIGGNACNKKCAKNNDHQYCIKHHNLF